jgi:hypothetical protein
LTSTIRIDTAKKIAAREREVMAFQFGSANLSAIGIKKTSTVEKNIQGIENLTHELNTILFKGAVIKEKSKSIGAQKKASDI